jgi:hypothetical protein
MYQISELSTHHAVDKKGRHRDETGQRGTGDPGPPGRAGSRLDTPEFDSLGKVQVPANRYWGAQTQRSLQHFNIGHDRMPKEVYHAYGYVKKRRRS